MTLKLRKRPATIESIEPRLLMSATFAVANLGVYTQAATSDTLNAPVADASGNLFGIEPSGGINSEGAIYKIAAGTHTVTTIASFDNTNGEQPQANLVVDASGNAWGETSGGGANGLGTLFEISAGTSTITTVVNFNNDPGGATPVGGLLLAGDGYIYGMTSNYGANYTGTLFKFDPQTSAISTLYSVPSGYYQGGPLAMDGGGNLYGATFSGGTHSDGTIFEYSSTSVFSTLVNFNGTNGQYPTGLVADSAGDLFGTTQQGGADNQGTLFEVPAGTGSLSTLFSFNSNNGEEAEGKLAIDSHGNLFGSTKYGASGDRGQIYEVPAGSTTLVTLDNFSGNANLETPSSSPYIDSNGDIYATALVMSSSLHDEVFKLYPATASQIVATTQPASYTAGNETQTSVEVEDSLGNAVVNDSAPLAISIATGPAGARLTTPPVQPQSGFATLAVDSKVAGNYVLEISDGQAAPLITSSFTITSGPATALKFEQVPSAAIIEAPLNPLQVETVDAFGNLVATDSASVIVLSLASTSNYGALGGTLTATADDGIATFTNVSINNAGSYKLAAMGGAGLHLAVSSPFSVSPLPVTQFVVASAPSSGTMAQTLSPVVIDLENADNAIVTGDTRAVTLSILNSTGTVTTATTVNAVAGVATFSSLSLPAAGSYTLSATDLTGTPAATAAVQIAAPVAPVAPVVPPIPTVTAGTRLPAIQASIAPDTAHPKAKQSATISIETGPAGARLLGATSVRVSNGIALFGNLTLTRTGTYTLKITDSTGTVTTVNRIVTPAATARLVFVTQPPAVSQSSAAFTISIEALDRFGNINTTATADLTVHLLPSKTKSTILTGTTTEPLINGVATFALAINLPGTHRLSVEADGLRQIVSKSFKTS